MSGFTIQRDYPHPPELVWRALTTPELLARWLMPNDFQPTVGHEFTFTTDPGPGFDGVIRCRVLEIDPPKTMSFTWVGGPIDTVVRFQLRPTDAGTHLQMSQHGFKGLRARLVGQMLRIGCRRIYGRNLPNVLNELAGRDAARFDDGCMSVTQSIIIRLIRLFRRSNK